MEYCLAEAEGFAYNLKKNRRKRRNRSMESYRPLIIGHRGAAGEAPENTLASFGLALEQGAEGIELDVHLSRDGRIVVCHDPSIDRTTNGKGMIFRMTAEEIRQYDAGAWFSEAYRGEKIPLLDEVFDLVPANIMINVEVKHSYEGHMETALLEFLRRRNRLDNVVISSFDHKCMQRIKRAEPAVKVGLLYAANLSNHTRYAKSLGVEVYSLHPHYQLLDRDDVAEAVEEGLHVYPYTVNPEEDYRKMIEFGVTGIITDDPARLAALLNS
jgi:glycerophosphoryl diester phosphodiesterase